MRLTRVFTSRLSAVTIAVAIGNRTAAGNDVRTILQYICQRYRKYAQQHYMQGCPMLFTRVLAAVRWLAYQA